MSIFLTLVVKLIPFYLFILLGFLAGKLLHAQKETVASLLIYMITPVIVFHGVLTTKLTFGTLSIPVIIWLIGVLMCLSVYRVSKLFWHDSTRNILAYTAGTGNFGYFGLPVAVTIFGEQVTGLVVLCVLGIIFFENTLGFFITARGRHTVKESLIRVITLPSIYTFLLALILNVLGVRFGQTYTDTVTLFRGAYTLLGMMLIGMGLSGVVKLEFDWKFIFFSHFVKFVVWPAVVLSIILLDGALFHIFSTQIYKVMMLMSVVPMAANTVAFATQLRVQPEKASVAVLSSTLFALIYIPLVVGVFLTS
ncbi:AEC family transporter [Patescibacteria group bacterium]|nr:AEC family transporter [Patescibacteria group bacterium]